MVKPTLNMLGACHRPALIEGQKENKSDEEMAGEKRYQCTS